MREFKHYILTFFNVYLYGKRREAQLAKARLTPDEWMDHRIELFRTYTLPSIAGQSCKNFTWVVMLDENTSPRHRKLLDAMKFPNLRLCYRNIDEKRDTSFLTEFEKGDYDLLTTRIDNDDAFHKDFVQSLHDCYRRKAESAQPWAMMFLYGYVLDASSGEMYKMKKPINNCPTMVENSQSPKGIWYIMHDEVPDKLSTEYIVDKPSWLMVVHSQNILNRMPDREVVDAHFAKPLPLSLLADFNIHLHSVGK
ncbi:MAG TPA: hypothetical protein ENH94_08240 [Phycisphaerales bacterium]|nr:hypothetical protein [Phycisphaerales bacterium]